MAYLYDHQNRHAPVRSNGKRFHGYPGRDKAIQIIVVHTSESALDEIGEDGGAESVARYQASTDRPSSYHRLIDRDSDLEMLPDGATAFGVVGYNSRALNISFAMRAADWGVPAKASLQEPALHIAARRVASWCKKHGIPARYVTKAQVDAGAKGITGHGKLDPGRRSDPGSAFPWERFIQLVNHYLVGGSPAPAQQEDDMAEYIDSSSSAGAVKLLQTCLHNEAQINGRTDSPYHGEDMAHTVDGKWGPNTSKALAVYQAGRVQGVVPGRAGGATLALLLRYEKG